jgi:hypothetical protein
MYAELLRKLEAALLRRNPGMAAHLQPGLPPDTIKPQLKKAGIKGNVDPLIELYSWHNGSRFTEADYAPPPREPGAYQLGFAPPTISAVPQVNIACLRSVGVEIDPDRKVYGSFNLYELERAVFFIKLWKKYSKSIPRDAVLVGRFVPLIHYSSAGQYIALDTGPAASHRLVTIQTLARGPEPVLREAYHSLGNLLEDLIRANENNQLLSCFQNPGKPIDLPAPPPSTAKTKSPAQSKRTIPATENIPALRTDFSDTAAWESLRATLSNGDDELAPALDFLSDPTFSGVTAKQLPKLLPEDCSHPFAVIIDAVALTQDDHPVLVVDLQEKPGRCFRSTPSAFTDVHSNLSIANMDFADFASAVDHDGIFRGFPEG